MPMILNFCNCNQKAAVLTIKTLEMLSCIACILLAYYNICFDFYLFDDVHSTNLLVYGYVATSSSLVISFAFFLLTLWGTYTERRLYFEIVLTIFATLLFFGLFAWYLADISVTLYQISPVDIPLDFVPVKTCFGVDLTTWVTTIFSVTVYGVDAYVTMEVLRERSGMEPEEFFKPPSKKELKRMYCFNA